MKRSKIVNTAIASTVVIILASGFLSAQQASGQQEKQPSQKGEMKSMGNMSMDGMMKECSEHHQAVTKSLDQTSKTLEGAKQSNDPDKMRAAIDEAQKQLADMKEHMTMCGNMMNMMQKMQGGMMKGSSK
jgi:hypothetical protein